MTNDTLAKLAAAFSDQSTADAVEKTRRFIKELADGRNTRYWFDDGFPRNEIITDARAALAVFEHIALTAQALPAAEPVHSPNFEPADLQGMNVRQGRTIKALRDLLAEARSGLAGGLWDFGPGQDEHEACQALIEKIDAFCPQAAQQAAQATAAPKLDTDTLRPLVARLALEIDPEADLETYPEALAFQIEMARAVIRAALPQPQPQSAQSKGDAA